MFESITFMGLDGRFLRIADQHYIAKANMERSLFKSDPLCRIRE
ncbi:Uncharacterised protein [Mycobacteroides abscessus subsp. abscessus]|nr:Uncharacterised protein [Mycobacteroides abscessus subsp. abscessus]